MMLTQRIRAYRLCVTTAAVLAACATMATMLATPALADETMNEQMRQIQMNERAARGENSPPPMRRENNPSGNMGAQPPASGPQSDYDYSGRSAPAERLPSTVPDMAGSPKGEGRLGGSW